MQRLPKARKRRGKNKGRRLRHRIFFVLGLGFLFLFFAGTMNAQEPVYKGPKALKDLTKTKGEASAGDKTDDLAYFYNPSGKTDPFKSFIAEQEPIEEKKRRKPRTYLETLDLSQLDLIAIVVSPASRWAMVRDAKGLGYVIKEGTPIGLYEGVVSAIRDDKVVVLEKFRDFRGREKTREVEKTLVSTE